MPPTPSTYEQQKQTIIARAHTRPDIRAALVVGSRARTDHPADRWSDLDLLLFTTAPDAYAANDLWRALWATLELFRWLAMETAERCGYPFPTRIYQRVSGWLFKWESGEFGRDSDWDAD